MTAIADLGVGLGVATSTGGGLSAAQSAINDAHASGVGK